MASGLVYRRFPKPRPIKFYGFDKVDRQAEIEIVERLMRPTTAYKIASEEVWSAEKQHYYSEEGARYPRAKTRCTKFPTEDDIFVRKIVRPASSDMTSSFSGKESPDRSVLSKERHAEAHKIDKIFRRLQRTQTQSSRLKMKIPISTAEAEDKKSRIKSANSNPSCHETLKNEITLDSADSRDIVQLIHELEDQRNEHLKLCHLRRPTRSSSMKYLGHCIYCNETEELSDWWMPRTTTSATNTKEKREAVKEQKKLMRRIRQPTMSSQNMASQSEHLKMCLKHSDVFKEEIRQKDLPLISGLPKSKNLEEINNRLMMRYRYDDYDDYD